MTAKLPLWQITAQDVMKQHRTTGEPILRLIQALSRARRLGSRDRKMVGEMVYGWIREMPWPPWFLEKLKKTYKRQADPLISALRERAQPILAMDRQKWNVDEMSALLLKEKIETQKSVLLENALVVKNADFVFENLPKDLQKALWLMDEASQIAARSIAAKPYELVLDICAGGGGKTRYLLQTGAQIIAMDISKKRIQASLDREGLSAAMHVVADGLKPPFRDETFDWILIDAPCSGTGTLRRAPDLLSRLTEKDIARYVQTQRALIKCATSLLKPAGKLVYATCSILSEENAEMASWIQAEVKALKPLPLKNIWGTSVQIEIKTDDNQIQLLPSVHGCDGFFVAAYCKTI